jgi:hypothetical protein
VFHCATHTSFPYDACTSDASNSSAISDDRFTCVTFAGPAGTGPGACAASGGISRG